MNKLPPVNRLQAAMKAAEEGGDLADVERAAIELGEEAVRIALCEQPLPTAAPPETITEAEALVPQRQRDLDAALADAIEVVARHRARLGRRVTSRHDGQTVRQVFELLRGMLEGGADSDASFQ